MTTPDPGRPDPLPRSSVTTFALLLLVVTVALAGVGLAAVTGRLDSALLFVGVPCALALGIGLLPSRTAGWGVAFQATTVVLLLASALLHEGALCVLIASPLVYGTVGTAYGLTRLVRGGRTHHLAAVPLLVLVALEGAVPGGRVNPEQQAVASQVVAEECADFEAALDRGPRIDPAADRGALLRWAQYPTPLSARGDGLAVGDTWELAMPSGSISTEVAAAAPGRLDFTVVEDTARTTRWVGLSGGTLRWRAAEAGCVATLTIDYTRRLDPSFWFGPVTDTFMDAGAAAYLRALD